MSAEKGEIKQTSFMAGGFTMIPNAVVWRHDLSIGAKLAYGYLSHMAWRARAKETSTPVAEIADVFGVAVGTARGYVKELVEAPAREGGDPSEVGTLLTSKRRGLGMPNLILIHDPQSRVSETDFQESGLLTLPTRARSLPEKEVKARGASPAKERKRNIVWDTLVEAFGEPLPSELAAFGKRTREVKANLAAMGVTDPDSIRREILQRARAIIGSPSVHVLANYWTPLGQRSGAASVSDEDGRPPDRSGSVGSCPRCKEIPYDGPTEFDPSCPVCAGTGRDGWCGL